MTLDKRSIALLYRKRAKLYDFSANAYYLLGFREFAYRKIGVEALNLKKGDTVVEVKEALHRYQLKVLKKRNVDCMSPR